MDQGLLGFATLLIGLATGRQPIDLLVTAPVVAVRLQVDGREVAALSAPPWRTVVDLGDDPMPHRVEAVGFDSAGAEVARAVQWANLPRPEVDLDLVLERNADGSFSGARIAWISARPGAEPVLRVTLDGRILATTGTVRIAFPPLDATSPHFLRVEADFGGGVVAGKQIGFGGGYSTTGASALTAVPATVTQGGKPVAGSEVKAATLAGDPLQIVAVEGGGARVVAVADRRALAPLLAAVRCPVVPGRPAASPSLAWANTVCRDLAMAPRKGEDTILLVEPRPVQVATGGLDSRLFTARQVSRTRARDVVGALLGVPPSAGGAAGQSLTNAVANSGLMAAAHGCPRAVVLLLGAPDEGGGALSISAVRQFLRVLGVPLLVWWPAAAPSPPAESAWGAVEDVSTCASLDRASRLLAERLGRQRVVWVEGLHLPQEVVLSSTRLARLE